MRIIVENIRSFAKRQEIPLRPLTLLVGENSSGKSTLMAVVSVLLDHHNFPGNPQFNQPPYNLGSFDTIVSDRGGKIGQADSISMGYIVNEEEKSDFHNVIATYKNELGNPTLKECQTENSHGTLKIRVVDNKLKGKFSGFENNGSLEKPIALERNIEQFQRSKRINLGNDFLKTMLSEMAITTVMNEKKAYPNLTKVIFALLRSEGGSHSFAPIRSKPKRTYDQISDTYSPEGDHIPTLLARIFNEESKTAESKAVINALKEFGKSSGLFKKIDVKRLGKKNSDPFQVQVGVSGPFVNLADVGYGVSQVLPIIVQIMLKSTNDVFLLQQPEVHLHPRAQAALGTFFASLAAKEKGMFLLETHSDYLVDRVRIEVAKGNIEPDQVQILFFHKPDLETTVYPIDIDKYGNVVDPPECYREFFLQEELNLLTRASR